MHDKDTLNWTSINQNDSIPPWSPNHANGSFRPATLANIQTWIEWSCWDVNVDNNEITWWFGIDIDSYPTRKETEYETTNQAVVGGFLFRSKAPQHQKVTWGFTHHGNQWDTTEETWADCGCQWPQAVNVGSFTKVYSICCLKPLPLSFAKTHLWCWWHPIFCAVSITIFHGSIPVLLWNVDVRSELQGMSHQNIARNLAIFNPTRQLMTCCFNKKWWFSPPTCGKLLKCSLTPANSLESTIFGWFVSKF